MVINTNILGGAARSSKLVKADDQTALVSRLRMLNTSLSNRLDNAERVRNEAMKAKADATTALETAKVDLERAKATIAELQSKVKELSESLVATVSANTSTGKKGKKQKKVEEETTEAVETAPVEAPIEYT